MSESPERPSTMPQNVDVVIVGAGFSGIGLGIRMRRAGYKSFVILERATDVGGAWRDNTYPGVACDIPSHLYSFSFRTNPDWSRMYAPGEEIWDYLRSAAREEGLLPHLVFDADMLRATWDDTESRWRIHTTQGDFTGNILVAATGHLTDPKFPPVPGLADFPGALFHSAGWDHSRSLSGKRVGVVGTGASAIQIIPEVAKIADELVVFQRSAPYVNPRLDRPFSESDRRLFRRDPSAMTEMRERLFWYGDYTFAARRLLPAFLQEARDRALGHLAAQIEDDELRAKLTPDYEIGCKRILSSNAYFPAMAQPHVRLETAALSSIEGSRAISAHGNSYEVDALIFATGFETYDLPSSHRVLGRGGRSLAEHWGDGGMQAYDSISVAGFPNLFLLNGPGTSLGHNSLIYMIETQIDHFLGAFEWWLSNGQPELEVSTRAEEAFGRELDRRAAGTVILHGGCSSWYLDPRNGRATLSWPDFAHRFRDQCEEFDPEIYTATA
ncbi:NAD(P)/FAD-dependent oxidoreductase [Nocardioides sp. CER19]|uniref:flavin-containing monooxygenase n=1 Tax=Nocardioides sp. CER19 TaxID=3038538 RepID=UPI0024476442|nr:NAD(P)/FAD-dependent oxidoreductase [Nocardioides sp. CER19]MDH2416153.1 NAD(P)/FAD-dependent oxidoreductase [Nocardioides sp. CER19]